MSSEEEKVTSAKLETSDLARPDPSQTQPNPITKGLLGSEDWWAIWLGGFLLAVAIIVTFLTRPPNHEELVGQIEQKDKTIAELKRLMDDQSPDTRASLETEMELNLGKRKTLEEKLASNPLKPWLGKVGSWKASPFEAFKLDGYPPSILGILCVFVGSLFLFGLGSHVMGGKFQAFALGFFVVFLLAVLAYILAGQKVIKYYHLSYALWALVAGMLISNTIGTPAWLRPALRTEFYIKTGLVLLGAEVLISRLLTLGIPGIFVAWVVTPIVLVSTFLFGQYVLNIASKSLNLVISADMSVCGVSAAIATAAACRAKKEELSLAIGLSLTFTVVMMVVLPTFILAVGMDPFLGGAWIGGTIDATGAVAAAGEFLGEEALTVAATVKMIQNILIGVIAFCVAIYWVSFVEKTETGTRPNAMEIWHRFPKFVLGFVAASLVFSAIYSTGTYGEILTNSVIGGTSKILRSWFFCLAFVSIGLETNFQELGKQLQGGKPLMLYVVGQTLNLLLTLLMAWLMFVVVFPDAAKVVSR